VKKKNKKEIDAAFDKSLKRAKSTYNWAMGARKALEEGKRKENKAIVKNTKVDTTKVKNTKVLSTKAEDIKLYFKGYYIVPNELDSALSKLLQPSDEIIYRKLYRWSWGYNRNYCQTSYSTLSKETNINSTRTIREVIHRLIKKGLIEKLKNDSLTNPKGSTYLIHIPKLNDNNKLSFIDTDSLVKNTKVDTTKVENTKDTLVKNTKVDTTKPISLNHEIPIHKELSKPGKATLVKNTLVNSTNKDKHIYTNNKKQTLSPHTLVKKFYSLLNQNKISKQKRERALRQINQLIQEGFSLKDINFTIEWTIQNKSGLHSFGIITETIGQALAMKEKYLKTQREKEKLEKEKQEKQRKQEKEEKLQQKIQQIRNTLSKEKLAEIHQEAENVIKNQGNNKKFGQDILIRLKENEIIRNLYLKNLKG